VPARKGLPVIASQLVGDYDVTRFEGTIKGPAKTNHRDGASRPRGGDRRRVARTARAHTGVENVRVRRPPPRGPALEPERREHQQVVHDNQRPIAITGKTSR
jgi:hypothetical protein